MRKIIGALIPVLLLILLLAVPCAAEGTLNYVTDEAGLFNDWEWAELENRAGEIAGDYGCGVYAVVVEDYTDYGWSMESVCQALYDTYGLGRETEGNAILLLVSMAERDYWLRDFGSGMAYAITDGGHEALKEAFLDDFRRDDFYTGLKDYFSRSAEILAAAESGQAWQAPAEPVSSRLARAYLPALVVGIVAAAVVCGEFKSQMKTAVAASTAEDYVTGKGVDFRVREDRFLHTTRTRVRIKNSSGGSGRSFRGGGNHSSGGKF